MLNYEAPLDRTFQALADPTRRAIVERPVQAQNSVSELKRPFVMSLPAVMSISRFCQPFYAAVKLEEKRNGHRSGSERRLLVGDRVEIAPSRIDAVS